MPLKWGTWAWCANLGYWGFGGKEALLDPLLVNVGVPQYFGTLILATSEHLEHSLSHFDLGATPSKVPQLSYNHIDNVGNFLIVPLSYNPFSPVMWG